MNVRKALEPLGQPGPYRLLSGIAVAARCCVALLFRYASSSDRSSVDALSSTVNERFISPWWANRERTMSSIYRDVL
jgi:hypothetical protein